MNPSSLVTTTESVDTAFYVIFGISAVSLLGILVAMVFFVWRYNRKRYPVPLSQKDHNVWLEVTWTIIPTILVMVMFWYGWEGYLSLRRIPDDAMHIKASARMWSWLFTYDNGKTADKLYVPVGKPVKIELIAEDVLHSFYVPAFRVKRDCVPGMPTYAWFVADKPGSYDLFCAEYCGVGHAAMITTVEALPANEFKEWLSVKPPEGDTGKALLQKHGCLGCHSLDGTRAVGPSFQGIGGREVDVTSNGTEQTLTVDADYLKRSILDPHADIVEGYPPAMPSYDGKIPDEELRTMVDYLMSLKAQGFEKGAAAPEAEKEHAEEMEHETREQAEEEAGEHPPAAPPMGPVARGEQLANQSGCIGCHSLDGTRKVGPSFKGLFGSLRTVTVDGTEKSVTADADYLKRSITDPGSEVVQGYPAAMPPYPGFSEDDLAALFAWLESLK